MRLSGLSAFVVLILSSFVFAQHHDTPSAPPPPHVEAPTPSPAPASGPSAPSASRSFSSSPAPVATPSHTSEPSASMGASSPQPHVAPSEVSVPNSAREDFNAPKSEDVRGPMTNSERVVPVERISGDNRVVGSARVGEKPTEEPKPKPPEPDLRHRICPGGSCKEPEPKPGPPESDLRHRICLNGPCTCPSGQTMSKNGCVATIVTNETPQACGAGQFWNGFSCVGSSPQCAQGQYWSGAACLFSAAECASLNSRASAVAGELYNLRARVEQACRPAPSSQECAEAKVERDGAIQRYRMLLTEGPSRCAGAFPDASIFSADFP